MKSTDVIECSVVRRDNKGSCDESDVEKTNSANIYSQEPEVQLVTKLSYGGTQI